MLFHTRASLSLRLIGVIGVAVQRKHERLQTPGLKPAVVHWGLQRGVLCSHVRNFKHAENHGGSAQDRSFSFRSSGSVGSTKTRCNIQSKAVVVSLLLKCDSFSLCAALKSTTSPGTRHSIITNRELCELPLVDTREHKPQCSVRCPELELERLLMAPETSVSSLITLNV